MQRSQAPSQLALTRKRPAYTSLINPRQKGVVLFGTRSKSKNLNKTGWRYQLYRYVPSLGPLGFPKMLRTTLRYAETFQLTLATATENRYGFRANGMFDPNFSGTGHQPLYFDQLTAIYNHWTVTSSAITVDLLNNVSTNGATLVLFADDDSTPNIASAQERGPCVMKSVNANSIPFTLSLPFDARKTFGGDPLANDNLQGSASADPTEQIFYWIGLMCPAPDSFTAAIRVVIDYTAVFDELTSIGQS